MGEAYDFKRDRVDIMFVNLIDRGKNFITAVNGELYELKDGKVNNVPRAVYCHLLEKFDMIFKVSDGDMNNGGGKIQVAQKNPWFFVQLVDAEKKKDLETPDQKAKREIVEEVKTEKAAAKKLILDEIGVVSEA